MDIKYGDTVVDKNNKLIGKINKVILDTWSGEPRKYSVRLEGKIDMVFFSPEQVDNAAGDTVKLNLAMEEIEND
jgi:plastocyanin